MAKPKPKPKPDPPDLPPPLTWIVPFRRAVVTRTLPYRDVHLLWRVWLLGVLGDANHPLVAWYEPFGGTRARLERGINRHGTWVEQAFATPSADTNAEAAGESTLAAPPPGFEVRLWKGPLRVLLEEAARGAGAPIATPWLVEGVIRPASKEEAAKVELQMGDVVELPLFRVLAEGGAAAYKDLELDPAGSFFLGTSVRTVSGKTLPPATAPLHDNLMAMRLQLMLSLYVGGFSSLGPVYAKDTAGAPQVPEGWPNRVFSRGVMYGGNLAVYRQAEKTHKRRKGKKKKPTDPAETFTEPRPYWKLQDLHWANETAQPTNVPTFRGWKNLPDTLPVTSASVCSTFTVFALRYFTDLEEEYAAPNPHYDSSVFRTMGFHDLGWTKLVAQRLVRSVLAPSTLAGLRWRISRKRKFTEDVKKKLTDALPAALSVANLAAVPMALGDVVPEAAMALVSLSGHEFGLVQLHPHDRLRLERSGLPRAGFFAAYHPLTGAELVTVAPDDPDGELWYIECTGTLKRCGDPKVNVMSAAPFRFHRVGDELEGKKKTKGWSVKPLGRLRVAGVQKRGSAHVSIILGARKQKMVSMACLRGGREDTTDADTLVARYREPRAWREIVVAPALKGSPKKDLLTKEAGAFYRERAVPFATMEEARDAWASHAAVGEQIAANRKPFLATQVSDEAALAKLNAIILARKAAATKEERRGKTELPHWLDKEDQKDFKRLVNRFVIVRALGPEGVPEDDADGDSHDPAVDPSAPPPAETPGTEGAAAPVAPGEQPDEPPEERTDPEAPPEADRSPEHDPLERVPEPEGDDAQWYDPDEWFAYQDEADEEPEELDGPPVA